MKTYRTIYHRWAQGRAIVRNRAMSRARALTALYRRMAANPEKAGWQAGGCFYHGERALRWLRADIDGAVRKARAAHRDWRKYRKLHEEHTYTTDRGNV